MFRLLKNIISIILIAGILFLILSLWKGGEPFRWFGNKSQKAGEIIKEKSESAGKKADEIKKKTEILKQKTKKLKDDIQDTKDKIKQITNSKE